MTLTTYQINRFIKPVVFLLLSLPAFWLLWHWIHAFNGLPNDLGFNPQETSNRYTGDTALRLIVLGLAISPLARLIKTPKPILFRRMIGLFGFFYGVLHIISYVWLDKFFAWGELWLDVIKRPYITVGLAAFILLIPLAVTSSRRAIKKLGAQKWRLLHRLVYPISVLAVIHFIMMRKGLQIEPLIYAFMLSLLLISRLPVKKLKKRFQNFGSNASDQSCDQDRGCHNTQKSTDVAVDHTIRSI